MSIVACFVQLSKKLMLVLVASDMTVVHRDCLVLASNSQWLEKQPLVSQGPLTFCNGQTHNCYFNIMMTCSYRIATDAAH